MTTGFVGTTLVRIEDGQFTSLQALAGRIEEAHVMTCDPVTGFFHMYNAVNPLCFGNALQLVIVSVNGTPIRCTGDVEFLLSDRTYKAASALVAGDVLKMWPSGVYALQNQPVTLNMDAGIPVFDMSVPGPGNFALAAGPFVRALGTTWTKPILGDTPT